MFKATAVLVLSFSMKINQVFDVSLADTTSNMYKKYKETIEKIINNSYSAVPGYLGSTTVTGFRPGSVIVDYNITASSDKLNLTSANADVVKSLTVDGFHVSSDSFTRRVSPAICQWITSFLTDRTQNKLELNALKTVEMTVDFKRKPSTLLPIIIFNSTMSTVETFRFLGTTISNDLKWEANTNFILKKAQQRMYFLRQLRKHGEYSCSTYENSMLYVVWQRITVRPYPEIQVSNEKVISCNVTTVSLQCCVQDGYTVEWSNSGCTNNSAGCISCEYKMNEQRCQGATPDPVEVSCQLNPAASGSFNRSNKIRITSQKEKVDCSDGTFGVGSEGTKRTADCGVGLVGYQIAQCKSTGKWEVIEDNCVLQAIQNLKTKSQNLVATDISTFVANLSEVTQKNSSVIQNSEATILTIVDILKQIANVSQTILVNEATMLNFLKTVDDIGSAQKQWVEINKNSTTKHTSSDLLKAIEDFGSRISNQSFTTSTNFTYIERKTTNHPLSENIGKDLTTHINIPNIKENTFITIIVLSAFSNILPVQNDSSENGTRINGDVVVVQTKPQVNNISLKYTVKNTTLGNPQCVFWNFSLLNNSGGWDSTGCKLIQDQNGSVTCECDHTTSFSVLMSPFTLSPADIVILDYITYIGVGISMACLVLCLIIEILIWKSVRRNETSYMRHVSIVNIAFSLLIADICFIIGAAIVKNGETTPVSSCTAVTFFMHFFYLALFFWMLLLALLLLYRTIMVFNRLSKSVMMATAFSVGYGAPLLIAVITVASTAGGGGYVTAANACWLNWDKTKTLLAFVIPALTIVAINLLVMVVVLYKILRRGLNASVQRDEKHALLVIAKCVGILTPLFGLTWGFGIGTMVTQKFGLHVVFALLNSLQGFFILVFGLLLDSKVREALAGKLALRNLSSLPTRSTDQGPSSSSGLSLFRRLRHRNMYNVSGAQNLSSSSSAFSSNNSYSALS
ncbi:adhesion G protein-coupled receptor F5-like [Trichomycterus rosablanca]|uniref:adhesion G protein-coupled receptor F5-like n=1 Tax=Trichomycterus rosablanca TaxID=2290929 RepID=UPI002F3611C6